MKTASYDLFRCETTAYHEEAALYVEKCFFRDKWEWQDLRVPNLATYQHFP